MWCRPSPDGMLPPGLMKAEVDEPRLVGMKREPIPCKSLTQHVQDPLGVAEFSNAITQSSA